MKKFPGIRFMSFIYICNKNHKFQDRIFMLIDTEFYVKD